jgi:hypothetical protein
MFLAVPPMYASSISNHADFCVMPISFASCIDEMPLRAVTTRYIA